MSTLAFNTQGVSGALAACPAVESPYRLASAPSLEEPAFSLLAKALRPVGHRLANLLMPMLGYSEMLHELLPNDWEGREQVEYLVQSSLRLNDMNDALVRLCHGTEGCENEIDLSVLVPDVLREFTEWGATPASVCIEFDVAGISLPVVGVYDAAYHMVRNLALNAMDAMPEGGVLQVRLELRVVDHQDRYHHLGIAPGTYMLLGFRDNGAGVPPACRETLFEPFVSEDRDDRLGVGLCYVYRAVRHFGGAILYNPNCEPGAEFVSFLSVAQ